ncbi:protein TTE1956-like [Mytilus trossulus]|uniref:protein TTE1956-like n=1 Tax=Mytilus trossulus TaxID=6551 RepID=UPI003004D851
MLFTAVIFIVLKLIHARIIGTFVMPHGGIALDPTHFNTTNATAKNEAEILHKSCQEVGQVIDSLDPDLVFLSTPHGLSDLNNFVFYLNPAGYGQADTDNCQCPSCCYSIKIKIDNSTSIDLIQAMKTYSNISGLSAFGPPGQSEELFPLRWGEVIPLHFLPNINRVKVAILSQPSRRYTQDVTMIPELLKLGSTLYKYLENLPQKVVTIISADLAHTHLKSGPYGYSDAAEPFDQAIGQWVMTLDQSVLTVKAAKYVDKALSCGYAGLVMLHGMMHAGELSSWKPTLYANYHPSYYGMMVASFLSTSHIHDSL